jgi:hypothetical protein
MNDRRAEIRPQVERANPSAAADGGESDRVLPRLTDPLDLALGTPSSNRFPKPFKLFIEDRESVFGRRIYWKWISSRAFNNLHYCAMIYSLLMILNVHLWVSARALEDRSEMAERTARNEMLLARLDGVSARNRNRFDSSQLSPVVERDVWLPRVLVFEIVVLNLALLYFAAAATLNRTTVTIGGGELRVKQGPVPWFANRRYLLPEIQRVYFGQEIDWLGSYWVLRINVMAVDWENRRLPLIRNLSAPQSARLISEKLQEWLVELTSSGTKAAPGRASASICLPPR